MVAGVGCRKIVRATALLAAVDPVRVPLSVKGSLSSALAAAGPSARLLGSRVVSGPATTCAIAAEGSD